ncbi:TIGR04282 family arsenosugar biosynthesis glycosyltransferase [Sagittula marina]|nr:TIGR04282 family arsenosugar biosynthesis glycosyltransferase [Sagittula marina]
MTPTLIIMVKEPRPGRVKTRLGREIGHTAACWWFRHQVTRLLRRTADPRWRVVLAVAPDRAVPSRAWPAHVPRMAQGTGDLGARMARMLRHCEGPVCLIGADIPDVGRPQVARAFKALGNHDAVFGPAPDGGFWLVGARHPSRLPHGFFRAVRWSTEHALSDSLGTLPGWRVAQVDVLRDVDTAADLGRS